MLTRKQMCEGRVLSIPDAVSVLVETCTALAGALKAMDEWGALMEQVAGLGEITVIINDQSGHWDDCEKAIANAALAARKVLAEFEGSERC